MLFRTSFLALAFTSVLCAAASAGESLGDRARAAIGQAGDNAGELRRALKQVPADQREGMEFLIAYMPKRDRESLSAKFLLENVKFAYRAWNESPWKKQVPKAVFLNNVLPYVNINERRDAWREEFYKKFKPLVAGAKTPGEAATLLNRKVFPLVKVKYSTKRRRADQSPQESIRTGLASCTGLSVLLIDACRAVGVPARFVGTPLWTNKSGNHSWVEVWDNGGWHYTGAAEPNGPHLDRAWFTGRAATAIRDHRLHAIYAVSFKPTPITFPLVWDRRIDYVYAVNVTDRYTRNRKKLPAGVVEVMFRAIDRSSGDRCAAKLRVVDANGKTVYSGTTNDERFDANNHVAAKLERGKTYTAELTFRDTKRRIEFKATGSGKVRTVRFGGKSTPR